MTVTLEFIATIAAGTALMLGSLSRTGIMPVIAFAVGLSLILWAVVGSNVASWIAAKNAQNPTQ